LYLLAAEGDDNLIQNIYTQKLLLNPADRGSKLYFIRKSFKSGKIMAATKDFLNLLEVTKDPREMVTDMEEIVASWNSTVFCSLDPKFMNLARGGGRFLAVYDGYYEENSLHIQGIEKADEEKLFDEIMKARKEFIALMKAQQCNDQLPTK
jgi:hypothetical protein